MEDKAKRRQAGQFIIALMQTKRKNMPLKNDLELKE